MLATIKLSHTIYNSDNVALLELYTAISIYIVGSKLQGYGTRPKGGMGRLELILGFRGCRREMDMEAENTISIALRVLTKSNKNRYDS